MAGIGTSIEIVDRVSGSLNRITASLYSTTSAFDSVDRASEMAFNQTSGVQAIAQEMYAYEQRVQQLESSLIDANNRLQEMEEQNYKVAQSADVMGNVYRGVVGILTTIGGMQVLNKSDELIQTTSRINMMNDGLQSTQELVQMVYGAAQDARGGFIEMADVVARFGNNAGSAFGSSAEIVDFANLIQKQMTIAGASTTEAGAAMLQLSQGLGSGVLRGDELNSIFEQAPNLIQNIASYIEENEAIATHMADVVGVSYEEMTTNAMGHIRDLASEGQISADIVKNAIFASADEINEKFEEMPMTWAQIWQMMQNTALMKFQPVLQRLNDIANSEGFQDLVDGATTGMAVIANTAITVFDTVGAVGTFMADNWSVISPIIYGVVAALAVYGAYLAITKGLELASTLASTLHSVAMSAKIGITAALTGSTMAATAAQMGYNGALYACPIVWIIILIIALVAAIIALCNWISKTTGVAQSGIGVIVGALAVAGAFIWNTIVGLLNGIIQFAWTNFVEPWIGIIEWVLNVINGGFDSFGDACANLIGNIISWFLSLGKVVTKIIDAIFGTDWTSGLNSLQSEVLSWGKNETAITLDRTAPEIANATIDYGTAWNAGSAWGDGVTDKISSGLEGLTAMLDTSAIDSAYTATDSGSVADSLSSIAGDTAAISDSVDISNENLKYLRDVAERDVINRFTTAEIKVDMQNNNTINNGMDIDGVISELTAGVQEAMEQAAEGVHE